MPEGETSTDLVNWEGGVAVELVNSVNNGDGTISVTYRSVSTVNDEDGLFIRIRFTEGN